MGHAAEEGRANMAGGDDDLEVGRGPQKLNQQPLELLHNTSMWGGYYPKRSYMRHPQKFSTGLALQGALEERREPRKLFWGVGHVRLFW